MPRSYLFINQNADSVIMNKEILQADALVIDAYEAADLFSKWEEYEVIFRRIKEKHIEILLKLDSKNLRQCYRALEKTKGSYIDGWVIPHASQKICNHLVMKAREYEQKQKLSFGTLFFLGIIDTPEGVLHYRNIAAYERIRGLIVDESGYHRYLGLMYDEKSSLIRAQISVAAAASKKPWIDGISENYLHENLAVSKQFGASAKATASIAQLESINTVFTPTENEILEAKTIYENYISLPKKDRKNLIIDNREISPYSVIRSQEILLRYQELNPDCHPLTDRLFVKGEKISCRPKIEPKKFYTIGEEIGNAISHGLGIVFSLVYMILLFGKGLKSDNRTLAAYLIYAGSAIILYLASTLYHGLPLGGRTKKLLQKFDHMTIYLLIAGTYTPFTLLALQGNLGTILCLGLWISAFAGLLLNVFWFGKFRALHMILYIAMGWIAVFYLGTIIEKIGTIGTVLLLAGGVSYTLGLIFYGLKLFKFTHMVWHLFVFFGTLLHFLSIYFYL